VQKSGCQGLLVHEYDKLMVTDKILGFSRLKHRGTLCDDLGGPVILTCFTAVSMSHDYRTTGLPSGRLFTLEIISRVALFIE
jgi:hypothetical protein